MAETSIQWADYTFNPWVGCQRVSPGCTNCYAENYDRRVGGVPPKRRAAEAAKAGVEYSHEAAERGDPLLRWGPKAPRTRTSISYWKQPIKWNALARSTGVRRRVFCASLADVFEDREELIPIRYDLFGLIAATPQLDWMLLTKRPQNIERLWPGLYRAGSLLDECPPPGASRWPNVWLGCTVEDQLRADERMPELLKVPAAVHFLSCEPLVEGVVLPIAKYPVDWVIVGGESGAGARPFDIMWAHALVAQARSVGAAPFVKQLGANALVGASAPESARGRWRTKDGHGGDPTEWPESLRVREFPKAVA